MPTYEYKCPAGHRFEKSYPRITKKRHATCPTCGRRAERLISGGAGLVFKGSGFYITDYKRSGKEETGKADQGPQGEKAPQADKADTADTAGKTEQAPEPKSAPKRKQ